MKLMNFKLKPYILFQHSIFLDCFILLLFFFSKDQNHVVKVVAQNGIHIRVLVRNHVLVHLHPDRNQEEETIIVDIIVNHQNAHQH